MTFFQCSLHSQNKANRYCTNQTCKENSQQYFCFECTSYHSSHALDWIDIQNVDLNYEQNISQYFDNDQYDNKVSLLRKQIDDFYTQCTSQITESLQKQKNQILEQFDQRFQEIQLTEIQFNLIKNSKKNQELFLHLQSDKFLHMMKYSQDLLEKYEKVLSESFQKIKFSLSNSQREQNELLQKLNNTISNNSSKIQDTTDLIRNFLSQEKEGKEEMEQKENNSQESTDKIVSCSTSDSISSVSFKKYYHFDN